MNKEETIKDICKLICATCAQFDGCAINCKAHRDTAETLYSAGYRKTFTSDLASDTQKAFKEGYIKGSIDRMSECNNSKDEVCKETAKEILDMLYDMGIDKGILECCRIYDVNGVSLAKQICAKYGVEIEK